MHMRLKGSQNQFIRLSAKFAELFHKPKLILPLKAAGPTESHS